MLSKALKDLPRAAGGNVAIVVALAAPLMLGAAGLGVETTYWSFKALHMQDAADAAAHAGALEQRRGSAPSLITAVATSTAQQNGYDPTTETIQINSPPTSGPYAGGQAVEVILHAPVQRLLTALFMPKDLILKARAVASFNTASSACILALNPTASKAALFSGSSTVKFNGCSVMANSTAIDAVTAQGATTVTAECLISGGGVQLTSGVTMTKCTTPVTQAPPVGDPFASVPTPVPTGNCRPSSGNNLQPGRYCSGLSLSGNVNLAAGVYYLTGDFKVNANANITGSGVTIYLVSGSQVNINGNATLTMSAPTTGAYAGILMMGDRAGAGGSDKVNGTAASQMTGAFYFPRDSLSYLGNFSGANGCTQVVADTIQWSGNSNIASDCTSFGMQPIPALTIVRMSE